MKEAIAPHLEGKAHVIWDWNGTLLDDVDVAVTAIAGLLKEYGLREVSRDEYLEVFCFPITEYYRRLGFDLEQHPFAKVADRFIASYDSGFSRARLHAGARELLADIKALRLTQSILSAAHEVSLRRQLAHFGIEAYFDHVYGLSDHYAASKVARGKELILKAGIPAEATLLIGDTDHDLEVGRELGVEVLLIADGHQSYSRLRALHHKVLETRHAVANP